MTDTEASTAGGIEDDAAEKDRSFRKVAALAEELVGIHGKDFTMGALVLAARFIAQDKPFTKQGMRDEMAQ